MRFGRLIKYQRDAYTKALIDFFVYFRRARFSMRALARLLMMSVSLVFNLKRAICSGTFDVNIATYRISIRSLAWQFWENNATIATFIGRRIGDQ